MRAQRAQWLKKKQRKALLKSDKTASLLIPLLLSMVLCSFLFVGATWALFTDSISNNILPTSSGKWTVSLQIIDSKNKDIAISAQDGISKATLNPNELYSVSIIPAQENNSQGICYITLDSKTYYTNKIYKDNYSFTVNTTGALQKTDLVISIKWGNATQDPAWSILNINDNIQIQNKTETTTVSKPIVENSNANNDKTVNSLDKLSKVPTTKTVENEVTTKLANDQSTTESETTTKINKNTQLQTTEDITNIKSTINTSSKNEKYE